MDFKRTIFPLLRWWWLLVAATLVAALASYIVTIVQPPVYQARTTLMIGRAIEDPNPSTNQFWLSQQLAASYADVANREMVRNATIAALGMRWLPQYKARAFPNSQLIEIVVTDTDPERAQLVANELANQLILRSPTSVRPGEADRSVFVNQQLDTLEAQIMQTQEDIRKLQAELGNMVSARQITDTQNQIAALQTKLTTLQSNYASLLSNTQRGAVNTLSVIEPATVPRAPIGPPKVVSILIAGVIGFVLAASAAYLLEYMDDTIRSEQDIEQVIGQPVIGYIGETSEFDIHEPLVYKHPRHPIAEAFRGLRTNLEFADVDQTLRTLLVTSADTEEGKTSVATNLAMIMAQGNKKVILLDADLRNPRVHEAMGMENDIGLTDVFRGRLSLHNVVRDWKDDYVSVVTAGSPPPNPAEVLDSKKMDEILVRLMDRAEMIIIDGPPFMVTDAAVLSAKVDGVLLVVRPGFTRKSSVDSMMEQIRRAGARVVGVVLNRIPRRIGSYYGRQPYPSYSYGYPNPEDDTQPLRVNGLKGWSRAAAQIAGDVRKGNFKPGARK